MKLRKVTLSDIAREAKVSPSTVSRALNDDPRISTDTKDKISDLSKKMGYRPVIISQETKGERTRFIGMLTNDLSAFYSNLYFATQQAAEEMGFWVVQTCTEDDSERSLSLVDSLVKSGMVGIIFASCFLDDPIVESLIDDGYPVGLVNRKMKRHRCDTVSVDNHYGAYLMINHLINIGYKRIAIITASLKYSVCAERYNAYLKAMADGGLPIDKSMIKHDHFFTRETGIRQTRKLMLSESPPEAIFCCDEKISLGCMLALKEMNIQVPEDVAVVGFDDADTELMTYLQLTTISYDVREMGRLAAKALIERINGSDERPEKRVLKPTLIIRNSCGLHMHSK
jgi:LacI family transcriptional regulator, galactose operon repressor